MVFYDDLEGTTYGWDSEGAKYGISATIVTDKAYSGTKSIKLQSTTNPDGPFAHSNKWISIHNNEPTDYIVSGWVYVESEGYAWGRLSFFMNEDGETSYYTEVKDFEAIKTIGEWVYVEETVTVAANIDKINLRVNLYHQSSLATAWFDDLKIEKVEKEQLENEIVEESNYYPFGLKHKGYNNVTSSLGNSTAQKFGFGGKELQDELGLGWLDYGARNYSPSLGRFSSIDPYAKNYMRQSPYSYVLNNPLSYIDYKGKFILPKEFANGRLAEYLKNGIQGILGNKKITNALKKFGGFTDAQLKESFSYGEGPYIDVKQLDRYKNAAGLYPGGGSLFYIDTDLIEAVEKAEGKDRDYWLFIAAVTILHEFVHYGASINGLDYSASFEEGEAFEIEVYGKKVSLKDDAHKKILKKWEEKQKEKKKESKENRKAANTIIKNFSSIKEGKYEWNGKDFVKVEQTNKKD